MGDMLATIQAGLSGPIGSMLGALAIFILGYIVALVVSAGIRKVLAKAGANDKINSSTGKFLDIEKLGAKIVFWFIFLIAISGAVNMLNISAISEPLAKMISQVLSALPTFLFAAAIGAVGWMIATVVRSGLSTALSNTTLDDTLSEEAGMEPIGDTIADIAYWVILLVVLTMVLGKLGLNGLFEPLTNMINKSMAFLPNIVTAGLIFFIGYTVAKIVRGIVTNIVSTMNLQSFAERAGLSKDGENSLPKMIGSLVFLVIIIPVSIAALDALKIEAISRPATNMLNKIMDMLPNIFTATALLLVTYFVVRMLANIVKELLANTPINALPEKIGMQDALGEMRISDLVGSLILFFAMLFASIMAADILGFTQISEIITMFIGFGANIMLGAVIIVIGFWLANLVYGVVMRSEQGSVFLANIVRVLIMGLVIAMGLRAMGIADSIVNLAFGLTLGSVAVAFALSFGLGGQEAAARLLRKLQDNCDTCADDQAHDAHHDSYETHDDNLNNH